MIIDSLKNLGNYVSLNPRFAEAFKYIESTDLHSLAPGKIVLKEGELMVNVMELGPKTKEETQLETHKAFVDIQIPLSAPELMGYTQAEDLPEGKYDETIDMALYDGLANSYVNVLPGMFAIFFPEDGHAPSITATGIKKIIIKVKA